MRTSQYFVDRKPESPGSGSFPITPADTDISPPALSVYVFGAGTIKFTGVDGSTDTYTIPASAVPFQIPIAIKRVWATGTTATDIHGVS